MFGVTAVPAGRVQTSFLVALLPKQKLSAVTKAIPNMRGIGGTGGRIKRAVPGK
jgi:hypothetical protein